MYEVKEGPSSVFYRWLWTYDLNLVRSRLLQLSKEGRLVEGRELEELLQVVENVIKELKDGTEERS